MLLAIDTGNSHTVIGLFEGKSLVSQWRIRTEPKNTMDELASRLHSLLSLEGRHFTDISELVIASVVPQVQAAWHQLARQKFSITALTIDHRLDFGINILIDQPAELGADRLVNAIAAYARFQRPLIIADFGTAITLDCVAGNGDYLGGVIAPGSAISLEALAARTAKLPRVDISTPPSRVIGKNTVDAMKAGILFGYSGMVEGLIERIREEMAPELPLAIATGGIAPLIAPHIPSIENIDPTLTLKGLQLLNERQRQ